MTNRLLRAGKELGMAPSLGRREFLKKGLNFGMAAALGGPVLCPPAGRSLLGAGTDIPDLAVVSGDDYGRNTLKALELLGGIERFVSKGWRVAILANVQSSHPGTFTSPAVLRAAVRICRQAGAKEVNLVSWQPLKNWESTGLAQAA
jgi:hypothetical protein